MKNNIKPIFVKESIAFILNVKNYILTLKVKAIFFYRLISSARAFDRVYRTEQIGCPTITGPFIYTSYYSQF